jgi:hypothetical protein
MSSQAYLVARRWASWASGASTVAIKALIPLCEISHKIIPRHHSSRVAEDILDDRGLGSVFRTTRERNYLHPDHLPTCRQTAYSCDDLRFTFQVIDCPGSP